MIQEAKRARLSQAANRISEIEKFVAEFLTIESNGDSGEVLVALRLTPSRAKELKIEAREHHLRASDALFRVVDAVLDDSPANEAEADRAFSESRRAIERIEQQLESVRDFDAEETVALLAEVAKSMSALLADRGPYLGKGKRRQAASVVDDLVRYSDGLCAGRTASRDGLEKLIDCADRVCSYLAGHAG